jgi:hypothetical protein
MTSRPRRFASPRAAPQISTGVWPGRFEDGDADALAQDDELLHRRWALHVGGDEQRLVALLVEPARELGRRGRFARALQANEHQTRRAAFGVRERLLGALHDLD